VATAEEARPAPVAPIQYAVVVTGNELLSGVYADGHTFFITRTLQPLGLQCIGSFSVDDKPREIQQSLRFAAAKSQLIIVTGGLGPTDNDVTRETLSAFCEIPLSENEEVLSQMESRFGVSRDQLRSNLRRQTRVPKQGRFLPNRFGSAVGLVFEKTNLVVVALPGPPRELQPMVTDQLIPYLNQRFGTHLPGCSLTIRFVGLGQSQIDQTMKDHIQLPQDIAYSTQFSGGRVDYTFSLPKDTPADRARLEDLHRQLKRHLGASIYGTGTTTLERRVVQQLKNRGEGICILDAGSGGALAARLSSAEEYEDVLRGALLAPSDYDLGRLLDMSDDPWSENRSPQDRITLLANEAAERHQVEWVLAVGEPHQLDGSRYISVAVRAPHGEPHTQRIRLRGNDESSRARLATALFDQLRRKLD
jgi:nicotinamide-nucleotide amidase